MRSLNALARRGLARRKARYALTASGTALGVAVLFGVLVASNAMTAALDRSIRESSGEVDVVVAALGSFDATFPADTEWALALQPGVERTLGNIGFRTSIIVGEPTLDELDARGTTVVGGDFIFVRGSDLAANRELVDMPLAAGRFPEPGAAELLITNRIIRQHDVAVGDQVQLAAPSGSVPVTIVGSLRDAGAGLANGGTVAYTSLETGRALLGRGDVLSGIDVVLEDGLDPQAWIDGQRDDLGASLFMQPSADLANDFRGFIDSVNAALTLTSVIALFVGGFLVFLTFSLAVAERTRDHGTLRALGAQPRQVRRLVVVEALGLGAFSSIAGLLLGYGIAVVVVGLTESLFGFEAGGLGLPVVEAVISVVVALVVCAAAAWVPARRAAALSPVVAMREGAAPTAERTGRPVVAGAFVAVGLLTAVGDRPTAVQSLGILSLLLGTVLAVPVVLSPLARLIGVVTRRLAPGVGAVAVMHLVKERSRSAYTLALVMVVLAMLVAVGAANAGMDRTLQDVVLRQSGSGLQVFAPNAFAPEVEAELAAVPGVTSTSPVRLGQAELLDGERSELAFLAVIEPESFFELASLPWIEGDDATARASLAGGGVIMLPKPVTDRFGVGVGDSIPVRTSAGVRDFEVAGTYAFMQGYGAVLGVADAEVFGAGRPNGFLAGIESGTSPDDVRLEVLARLGVSHDATVATAQATLDAARAQLQGFFGIGYAMLGIAGVVGVLGLANTLVVSVLTRSREIGILRSNGARRRQVGSMVLVEGSTLVVAALVLAAPLGGLLALGVVDAQASTLGFSVDFTYPWGLIVPLAVITLGLAALASLIPARRAARLEIVEALRFD